ncbi:MAG: helix-hairpin-helix domain-containing protein [Planctomycetes bacterium]|nr:helix-hairpin-helix domain-containing protein [Planctomycetota bacterium]
MAEREIANPMEAGRSSALRAVQSLAFLVGLAICLVLTLGFAGRMLEHTEDSPASNLGERINPNEAPVASLMRLPQIGAARARAIVAHRNRAGTSEGRVRVFRKADDLRQIKGIGPAIVEDVRPWLRFDSLPRDGNEPPAR